MNRQIAHDTWQNTLDYALKLSTFCARVALAQYEDGKDWVNEQPVSSDMYKYDPWPKVRANPRTVETKFDQCQCGAKTRGGQDVNKPTSLWASDGDLTFYFEGLRCGALPDRCNGNHATLRGELASEAQVWPWDMAQRLAWGVQRLLARRKWQRIPTDNATTGTFAVDTCADSSSGTMMASSSNSYPTAVKSAARPKGTGCPGCQRNRPMDHTDHNRVRGVCRYPDVESVNYPCLGCRASVLRSDPRHTHSEEPALRRRIPTMRSRQPGHGLHDTPTWPEKRALHLKHRRFHEQDDDREDEEAMPQ